MVTPQHLFWDSCVFTAYLAQQDESYDLNSIEKYLTEAKAGHVMIHASTISSAEVLPSQIKGGGSFEDFLEDFQGAVHCIDPNPNIMRRSGIIRDLPYSRQGSKRALGTPDAIILATALYVQEAEGISLQAFHTFDKGGKGKSVPLIGLENWCEGFDSHQKGIVAPLIALDRLPPIHPEPELNFRN